MNDKKFYELYKNCSQAELNNHYMTACNYGEFQKVQYLLTSPELKIHADINYHSCSSLTYACTNEHWDILKYILTSSELQNHADIHANSDHALYCSAINGNLNIVKYLLSSPELKEHANIHANNDGIFCTLCSDHEIEIITYLIFEYNIEKTSYIEDFLDENKNDFNKQIKDMFDKRELANGLVKELSSDRINKKKLKL
jgi:ankyrin repeat protein